MEIVVAGHICLDVIPKWPAGSLEALQPGTMVVMDGISRHPEERCQTPGSPCVGWVSSQFL